MFIKQIKTKPVWRSVFVMTLAAAIFSAIFKSMDNYSIHNYANTQDVLTGVLAYLVVGGWIGFFCGIILAQFIHMASNIAGKRLIDPDFNGLKIRHSDRYAVMSGVISALGTMFFLWGNKNNDPSVVIALGNGVIVYTVLYDAYKGYGSFRYFLLPIILVMVGGALATFSGSVYVTLLGIFLIAVISNSLFAFSEVVEQKGVRKTDSINLYVWRFFWLAFSGTALAILGAFLLGSIDVFISKIQSLLVFPFPFLWIVGTMTFVFIGVGLKLIIKKTNVVSVVLLILSVQIVLGYPITLIGNAVQPGAFGTIPTDMYVWIIRMFGGFLMIVGVFILRKKDPVMGKS